MGWIDDEAITLGDIEVMAKKRNATAAMPGLDGVPIAQAKRLLISLGARAVPKEVNRTPYNFEPLKGQPMIKAM